MQNSVGTRRHMLASGAMSLGAVAAAWLADREAAADSKKPDLERRIFDTQPKKTQQPASANAMISLWMQGGPSHHDMFDPKPLLDKYDGKSFPGEIKYDNAAQASSKVLRKDVGTLSSAFSARAQVHDHFETSCRLTWRPGVPAGASQRPQQRHPSNRRTNLLRCKPLPKWGRLPHESRQNVLRLPLRMERAKV